MRKQSHGMTLIEVLVAFVVLSISLAVIMQIFSGGLRNAMLADSYNRALLLAESKLATAGVEKPLVAGEDVGQSGRDFRWRMTVKHYDDGGSANRTMIPVRLFEVRAQVTWLADGRERLVELTTLRLAGDP